MDARPPALIGPEQAVLIGRRVSIIVGSRDADLRPHVMRALACRLSEDRRRVSVILPEHGSRQLLEDLRANGCIAVVFSEPTTDRTLQVKGDDAVIRAADDDDAARVEQHLRNFVDEIGQLGFGAEVAHTMLRHDAHLVAVEFTVGSAFEQTPGPSAGEPLAPPPAGGG